MKIILLGFILLIICNCSKNYGYIYDIEQNKPIEGVIVKDISDQNNKTITNTEGKFSFSECNDLILVKKGYKTDTLQKYGCKPKGKCFDGHIFYMKKISLSPAK